MQPEINLNNLKISPFFQIERKKDSYTLIDIISGKKFLIGDKLFKAIIAINKNYPSEIEATNDFSDKQFETAIEKLVKIGYLGTEDNIRKQTYKLKFRNNKLFGFQEFQLNEKLENKRIVLIGIPFGKGNGVSDGTNKFPEFLRNISNSMSLDFCNMEVNYNFLSNINISNIKNLDFIVKNNLIKDGGDIFVHDFESINNIYDKISIVTEQILNKNIIPFFIGGDHSITYPILKGFKKKYKKFNVIHFDAHTDNYKSGFDSILNNRGLHHHGNFVLKALKIDNIDKYYQFGIRGINNAFADTNNPKLKIYWCHQIIKQLSKIDLPNNDYYYITFDIDILDPLYAPATATPIPEGPTVNELYQLFDKLLKNKKIIGVDFVEVNPSRDIGNITSLLSINIIFRLISYINLKN